MKPASVLVNSTSFSPLSITELSSGLATVELLEGRRRRSRNWFRSALLKPNENSLAQLEMGVPSMDRLFDVDVQSFDAFVGTTRH